MDNGKCVVQERRRPEQSLSWPLLGLLVWVVGCTPAIDGPTTDSGVDGGADGDVAELDGDTVRPEPLQPESPSPPLFVPCAEGWREEPVVEGSDLFLCRPWPATGRQDCDDSEAHFPGEPGCRAVGAPCTSDGWPSELPEGTLVYVLEGAHEGGDGSRERPFATIGAALDAVSSSATIVLGRGTYDEPIALRGGVTLLGTCPAETIVTHESGTSGAATVEISGDANAIKNVTISGGGPGIVVSGEVDLEGVVIRETFDLGIDVRARGTLTGLDVVIRNVRAPETCPPEGCSTAGLRGIDGQITLDGVLIEDIPALGVLVIGTELQLIDVSIVRAGSSSHHQSSAGLLAGNGAQVDMASAVVEESHTIGIMSIGAGTSVTLTHAIVGATRSVSDGMGMAIATTTGSTMTLRRGVLEDNISYSVFGDGEGTEISLEDVVLSSSSSVRSVYTGTGLTVVTGARASIGRALINEHLFAGLTASDEDTELHVEDVTIRDNEGPGLYAFDSATVTVARALFENNGIGGVVAESLASVELEDGTIRASRPITSGDAVIGTYGRGVDAVDHAQVTLQRVLLEQNHETSLFAASEATVMGEEVTIRETQERQCGSDCEDREFGVGLCAILGAKVELTGFEVSNSSLCGVLLATEGEIDLHSGIVTQNPIGVNLQVEGYDVERLTDDVDYRDNELRFDSSVGLPPPTAELPFEL